MIDLSACSKRLKYTFKKQSLLRQALTHRSAGITNNERLEFLGDAILSFVISNVLMEKFPAITEGQLTRLRAFLVNGDTLAELAMKLQLGDFLYLGQGELKSGGFRRASILADALEAIIAAIYLDSNLQESQNFILNLYKDHLNDKDLPNMLKDSKTQLQEFLQSKKLTLPKYELIKIKGEEPDQVFYVSCAIENEKIVGQGTNRRKAEQDAAQLFLERIKKDLSSRTKRRTS